MIHYKNIMPLLERVEINKVTITCYFKCTQSNTCIASSVAFEPYDGAIILTWRDILFHPIKSYKRYYHTPIVIYGKESDRTIVLKAFKQVSNNFRWDKKEQKYYCN